MQNVKEICKNQSGFTLTEALIALAMMSIGLLALASAFIQGIGLMSTAHSHQIAKEKASEAMESVFTARDARKVTNWNLIQNMSRNGNALFLDGPQPLRTMGADGLVNTLDDGGVEEESLAGADGTPDTVTYTLSNFQREIEIRDINTNLRRIRVIITYKVGSVTRQYELISYMSPFA